MGGQQTHTFCEKYCNCILLLTFTHAINYMEVCTGGWGTEGSAVSSRAQAFTDKHTDYIPKLLAASPRSKRSGKMFHHSSIGRRSEHSINKSLGNCRVEGNTLQNWEDLKVLKACLRQKWVTGAMESHCCPLLVHAASKVNVAEGSDLLVWEKEPLEYYKTP